MGGLDDLMAESADRWATAERRAEGVEDKGLGQALRAYFTVYLPIGVVLLFAVGVALGMLTFQGEWANSSSYLIAGTLLAGLGAIGGGIIFNAKVIGAAVEMGRINVLMSLEANEQKQLRREILGKTAIRPEHMGVKRAAAVQARKGLATQFVLLIPILEFQFLVQVLNDKNPIGWLSAIVGIAFTVFLLVPIREFRALGRFLKRTAETPR